MITGVKVIQYHLTKLEDAEKELAEVLNSGYTFYHAPAQTPTLCGHLSGRKSLQGSWCQILRLLVRWMTTLRTACQKVGKYGKVVKTLHQVSG